jgi:hypothetical protein
MNEHSKLPPSSASRRVACPGSRALEEPFRDGEQSPAAREGTAAHEVAAWYLNNDGWYGAYATNGEPVTEEMIEGAKLYRDAVFDGSVYKVLHIEERVDISTIHPDCWGTPDCWYVTDYSKELHIFDYKFGHGYVEVFENWQLIEYAAGILELLEGCENITVVFHIVQPRTYHPDGTHRTWRVSRNGLKLYFDRLRTAEREACNSRALTHVSPECNNCLARHVCPSLRYAALEVIDVAYENTPERLTPENVGGELRYLMRAKALLDARIEGLTQEATSLIRKGEKVSHFTLQASKGRRCWSVPIEEVIKLGELLKVDLVKPKEVITPSQAMHAGIAEELIEVYCPRSHGALKLIPIDPQAVHKIFRGDK